MTPQWKVIYNYMKKGKKVTPYSALKLCRTLCLHKRIDDIERFMDVEVKRDWKRVNKRTRVMEYRL